MSSKAVTKYFPTSAQLPNLEGCAADFQVLVSALCDMSTATNSLVLIFTTGVPLTQQLKDAVLRREPGLIEEFQLTRPLDKVDSGLESRLSSVLMAHKGAKLVVLHGFAFDESIPTRILLILGSQPIKSVERLEIEDGLISLHDHRPMEDTKSRVLMVFPGPIIPIVMGSHRRAFQLAANLTAQGCPVDLLITGGNKRVINEAKPLLYQIAGRVSHYTNRRPQLPPRQRWRKRFERYLRFFTGIFQPPPDLFEERLNVAASFSGCKALRRLIECGHYRSVIINYAWMANIRKLLEPTELRSIAWVCDSHDVQFVRNATDNLMERRFFRSAAREKACEIEVLNSFDKVLAISEPDAVSLRDELGASKVIFTPTGFDYALGEPRTPEPDAPVFGFIGRLMRANEKALQEIIDSLWPAIHQRWPKATLHIAGSICQSDLLANDTLPAGMILDHMVADLSAWYDSIDVMLNPVMVQGGMNYKSLEAVMAGKLLITNKMGSTCLSNAGFALLVESGKDAVAALERALADTGTYLEERRRIRDEAREIFGDAHANQELLDYLRDIERHEPLPAVVHRPQRVLIQCGNHLENRIRITALAKGIRERGHHPVVLVYKQEFVAPFLSLGIDAIALEQFETGQRESLKRIARASKIKSLSEDYNGYNLDDISGMWQMQKPQAFLPENRRKTLQQMLRYIDLCAAMLKYVAPDLLVIWNGHTGWVANILRHHARRHGLPKYLLERSIFADGVFIDPLGSNGNSELSRLSSLDLANADTLSATRSIRQFQATCSVEQILSLRTSGPWSDARKIILIPLQVQSDTNILLYSPRYQTMADFVTGVHRTYYDEGVALIVRPHPEEVATNLRLPKLPGIYIDSKSNLDAWIEAADVVVTINSTVGMQALFKRARVRAFGHGIYTGKGFTHESLPREEELLKFWNLLLTRYTSTPDHKFPHCLEQMLPQMTVQLDPPKNSHQIDPDASLRAAEKFKSQLRTEASNSGILWIITGAVAAEGNLDLDYRRTSEPFSADRFSNRLRQTLELPPEIEIRCIENHTGQHPCAFIHSGNIPAGKSFLDKYGSVIILPELHLS